VADFPTELALAVVDGSAGRTAEENLHLLLRRNMVHYDTGRGRWWLHQLLRDLARHQLERASEWQLAMWRYAQAVVGIARAIQAQYEAGGDAVLAALARFDTERPHVDAGCGWMANHAGTAQGDRLLLDAALATRCVGALRYDVLHQRIPLWERARAAAQRLGDRDAEARALNNLGIAYAQLGDPQQAIPYYEQMLAIVRASGDRRTEKLALGNLGRAYADLGDPRQAIDYFEQVLAIVRALGDRRMEGIALGNLGNAYTDLGEARRAIAYFEEAVALARASGDDTAEGLALGNLGRTYVALDQAGRAISYFTQALALARALGDRRGEGYALHNLGYAYTDLGDIQRAINTCAAAHTIARELGELRLEGYVLSYLARAQALQNNLARAATTFAQAVALLRQVGDRWGEAECQWQVGLALAQQGQRDQALPLLRAAVAYEQKIAHAKVAEHAALLACLEAGAALPFEHLPRLGRRVVEQDADMASRVDQLPNREIW
jgi:tetratricopeptide (TPR) repeat protein